MIKSCFWWCSQARENIELSFCRTEGAILGRVNRGESGLEAVENEQTRIVKIKGVEE